MTLAKKIRKELKVNGKKLSPDDRKVLREMAHFLTKTKGIYELPSIKKYEELGLL